MDPNGNFVTVTPLRSHAQTVMVSQDELDKIRAGSAEAAARKEEQTGSPRYSKLEDDDDEDDGYEDDEYDDEEYDDDYDEDDDEDDD